jgi:hypothetical protein
VRAELDSDLGVLEWQLSDSDVQQPQREGVDPDAPAWWHGDEEASASFMRAMGVS